jgi:hypothetical protein
MRRELPVLLLRLRRRHLGLTSVSCDALERLLGRRQEVQRKGRRRNLQARAPHPPVPLRLGGQGGSATIA